VWLFTLFGKDEATDLTPDQKRQLERRLRLNSMPVNAADKSRTE
jgi:hypothetical protein